MKLHRIGITNLNSLYGTHTVDLDRDLEGARLFLIQGPTGSGKSTLMDAVSLALFGTTPRMEDQRSDRSVAEQVMSRDTGTCRAELVFSKWSHEEGRRIHYRASWAAWRARERPDGQMQATERSLERRTDEGSWEILVSDKRQKVYQPRFDEVLEGFSQEDFRRSMLLAQGQFDAMLHARPEERARILERLTDTSDYKRLGERAARIHRAWRDRIRDLDRDLQSREAVNPEKVAEAEKDRAAGEAALAVLEERIDAVRVRRDWLKAEAGWAGKVEEAEGEREKARGALEARAELAARIQEHERCADAFAVLGQVASQRARVEAATKAIEELEAALPGLRKTAESAVERQRALATRHAAAEAALHELEPTVDRAEKARIRRVAAEEAERRATAVADGAREGLKDRRDRASRSESGLADALDRLPSGGSAEPTPDGLPSWRRGVDEALRDHRIPGPDALPRIRDREDGAPAEEAQPPRFEGAARRIRELRDQVAARRNGVQRALEARVALASAEAARGVQEEARTQARQALETASEAVERTEREREAARERLSRAREVMAPLERIRVHAEERRKLEEGRPCPLCGSEHHPLAGAEADSAVRREIATAQAELQGAEDALREADAAFHNAEGNRTASRAQLAQREAAWADAGKVIREAAGAWTARAAEIEVDPDTAPAALRTLEEELETARAWVQEVLDGVTAAAGLFAEWTTAGTEVRTAELKLREAEKERDDAVKAAEEAREAFEAAMTGVREAWRAAVALDRDDTPARPGSTADPTALKESQQGVVRALSRSLGEARETHAAAEQAVVRGESERATRTETRAADAEELARLDRELASGLEALGLDSPADLAERRLDDDTLRAGRQMLDALRKAVDRADSQLETLRKEQRDHAAARPDPFDLDWMEGEPTPDRCAAALEALSRERIALNDTVTVARSVLLEAERVAEEIAGLQAERERARARAEVWHRLHDLIGVNDGDRFREFAQALNLDQLLDRANAHLATLKDRYRLVTVRDPDTGVPTLEFEVEDRWRPGTTRSLKTLSGGESFLVSLALALGLSDLRTGSMPVETLLLDEGFGTLDPETLDEALSALQQLQASGRQIGIISHVAGLQERIDARIQVEPLGNGRSRVRAVVAGLS